MPPTGSGLKPAKLYPYFFIYFFFLVDDRMTLRVNTYLYEQPSGTGFFIFFFNSQKFIHKKIFLLRKLINKQQQVMK